MHTGLEFRAESECIGADENLERQVGKPGWLSILHRDVKPRNIFLRHPEQPYDCYPQPVLADLDALLELPEDQEWDEPGTSVQYAEKGQFCSPGWVAPVCLLFFIMKHVLNSSGKLQLLRRLLPGRRYTREEACSSSRQLQGHTPLKQDRRMELRRSAVGHLSHLQGHIRSSRHSPGSRSYIRGGIQHPPNGNVDVYLATDVHRPASGYRSEMLQKSA